MLFPFQKRGVESINNCKGRCLLADQMGMGKSIQSITWAVNYLDRYPIIVICPASLKSNWEREWITHVKIKPCILESTKPHSLDSPTSRVYIINYDVLHAWLGVLKSIKPSLIILDECHYLAGRGTRRTRSAKYLCHGVPHVIGLSGTPLTNRPADLFSTLNIIRPDLFPYYSPYAWEYCGRRKTIWGWDDRGARNLDKLHRELKDNLLIRRVKEDVLEELPPKIRTVVLLQLDNMKEYVKAEKNFLSWLGEEGRRTQTNFKREQRTQLIHLKKLVGELKLSAVKRWINSHLEEVEEKTLVFAHHVNVVDTLYEEYEDLAVMVNGSVTGKKRQREFDIFNNKKSVRLFVGNIKAAGVGWNAKHTSTVAFAELPWTPGEVTQAEDRPHGISRGVAGKPLNVYFLIAKGTIEEDLARIIQRKSRIAGYAIDGVKRRGDLDVYSLLTDKIKKRTKDIKSSI